MEIQFVKSKDDLSLLLLHNNNNNKGFSNLQINLVSDQV